MRRLGAFVQEVSAKHNGVCIQLYRQPLSTRLLGHRVTVAKSATQIWCHAGAAGSAARACNPFFRFTYWNMSPPGANSIAIAR